MLPLIFSLVAALSIAAPLAAQNGYAVQKITFKGNETISSSVLRLVMETKSVGTFAKLLGKRGPEYDEEVMAQDLERITALYQREGFLSVMVAPVRTKVDRSGKTVKLTIVIDEGEPIEIRQIETSLMPTSAIPDSILAGILKRAERDLVLRPETRFRDSSVFLDQLLLARQLADVGYPYADIVTELTVSKPDRTVDVTWRIKSGPACTFGEARILGVSKVPPAVVARQIAFREGETFRLRLVEQSQQQVYGLGVFQVATVNPTLNKDSGTVVPVETFVKDAKRFTTKFGVGYGTEDHVRVSMDTRLLGFLGGARRLQVFAKHSYLEPYHVAVTLTQPAFPTPRTTLTASPFVRRQREPAYTVNRIGGSLGAAHQFSPKLSGSITYSLEQVKVDKSVLMDGADGAAVDDLYNKSQVIVGTSFDNSAPLFNPRRGFYNANSIALSGLGFGSKTRYLKTLMDLRRYQPLAGLVLAARIKVGGIKTFGDGSFVPVEERFYSGGSSSVRGWGRSELGPHEAGQPVGGSSLLEASAELRYPIIGIISGVIFGDAGNVWTESFTYEPGDLRYAAGVGIRITTPIGPIRFDVARPVADDDKKTQFHISVGQAF